MKTPTPQRMKHSDIKSNQQSGEAKTQKAPAEEKPKDHNAGRKQGNKMVEKTSTPRQTQT